MAEILVKATNASHANPTVDQGGCYKRGYPVLIRPDGHPWGALEGLPRFVLIKIPLISTTQPWCVSNSKRCSGAPTIVS